MKRKNHQLDRAPRRRSAPGAANDDLRVVTAKTTLDLGRWRYRTGTQIDAGRDELLLSMTKGLRRLQPLLADNTINGHLPEQCIWMVRVPRLNHGVMSSYAPHIGYRSWFAGGFR